MDEQKEATETHADASGDYALGMPWATILQDLNGIYFWTELKDDINTQVFATSADHLTRDLFVPTSAPHHSILQNEHVHADLFIDTDVKEHVPKEKHVDAVALPAARNPVNTLETTTLNVGQPSLTPLQRDAVGHADRVQSGVDIGSSSRPARQHREIFHCPRHDCLFSAPYRKDLRRHQKTHSKARPYYCPYVECEYTSKGFSRKDTLDRHVRRVHRETGDGFEERSFDA